MNAFATISSLLGSSDERTMVRVSREGDLLRVTWPTAMPGIQLERCGALAHEPQWAPVDQPVAQAGGLVTIRLPHREGSRFLRLHRP